MAWDDGDSPYDRGRRRHRDRDRQRQQRRREQRARRERHDRESRRRRRDRAEMSQLREHQEARRERSRSRQRELTPEQRAWRDARRKANAKLSFMIHLVAYASVCLFLLFVAGFRPAFITAMAWGIGLSMHYFVVVLAPGLRRRWIEQEVRMEVGSTSTQQRQELEGKHARHLEELSASLAHEIRNPITAAKSLVQQVGEDPRSPDNVEYAKVALEELDRVERSISHLLRFAREEELALESVRMADIVESALSTFGDRLQQLEVEVRQDFAGEGVLQADAEKLRRVVINLVNNALDALDDAAARHGFVEISSGENLAGTEIWLRVRDNGPGIEPERLERIFSPFFTSKSSGTGLGLAISKKLIDAHGGVIEASSQLGQGTEFVITLPKRARASAAAGADPETETATSAE